MTSYLPGIGHSISIFASWELLGKKANKECWADMSELFCMLWVHTQAILS